MVLRPTPEAMSASGPDVQHGVDRADRRVAGVIADIVRSGVNAGDFHVADVDVAARRLLTMIDRLGAQMVGTAVPSEEAKHIARSYFTSELGLSARKAISDSGLTPPQ